jgi:glycosyltransferase involved in cell wall biosynthesis
VRRQQIVFAGIWQVRKKALMACSNYWTTPFQVGSHHIARGLLAAGWEVAFVSDPISPFHVLAGVTPELKDRYDIYIKRGINDCADRLWAYVPAAALTPRNKPVLKSAFVYNNWHSLTYPAVDRIVEKQGFGEVDLLYIDSAVQYFWLDKLKYKKSVFRVADNNSAFEKTTPRAKECEKTIAQKADVVAYTATSLKEYVLSMKPKAIHYMPNGVNFEHFCGGFKNMPEDLAEIPKPIAIYIGAIAEWFDYDLLNKTAKLLPAVSFVLIGNDEAAKAKLAELSNVYLLGKKAYQDIPRYLYNAQVGIIPFDTKNHPDLVNNINPLKLYEYMACGLPVVSARWRELTRLAAPVFFADDPGGFAEGISASLTETGKSKEKYIIYAKTKKWDEQIEKLLSVLDLK